MWSECFSIIGYLLVMVIALYNPEELEGWHIYLARKRDVGVSRRLTRPPQTPSTRPAGLSRRRRMMPPLCRSCRRTGWAARLAWSTLEVSARVESRWARCGGRGLTRRADGVAQLVAPLL